MCMWGEFYITIIRQLAAYLINLKYFKNTSKLKTVYSKIMKYKILPYVKSFIVYLFISTVNEVIVCYIIIKEIKIIIHNILTADLLNFKYKKLFIEAIREIKLNIHNNKDMFIKVFYIIDYLFRKYVLNCSFLNLCVYYLKNLHITNLKLHIKGELDIYAIFKKHVRLGVRLIKLIIGHTTDKLKYESDNFYFVCNYSLSPDIRDFLEILEKIKVILESVKLYTDLIKNEIKTFNKIFNPNYREHILLSDI